MVSFVLVPGSGQFVLSLAMGSTMYQRFCLVDMHGIKESGLAYADEVLEVRSEDVTDQWGPAHGFT